MENFLLIIAVSLIISLAMGLIGFHPSGLIHVLLVIALIVALVKVIAVENPFENNIIFAFTGLIPVFWCNCWRKSAQTLYKLMLDH